MRSASYNREAIQILRNDIIVGSDVYSLDDVLYADVVDVRGNAMRGLVRAYDWLFIGLWVLWAGIVVIAFINLGARTTALVPLLLGPVMHWSTQAMLEERTRKPSVVRIYTRDGTAVEYRTPSLLKAQLAAKRINRAARRRMLG